MYVQIRCAVALVSGDGSEEYSGFACSATSDSVD